MHCIKRENSKSVIWYLSAALLIVSSLLMTGAAYARYRSIYRSAGSLDLNYGFSNSGISLLAPSVDENGDFTSVPVLNADASAYETPGDWDRVSADIDEYTLSFLLSNASSSTSVATYDQDGYIRIFVTNGTDSRDGVTVTLESDGKTYTAVSEETQKGSAVYRAYGPGKIYRFFDNTSEELCWHMPGEVSTSILMTLTVRGTTEYPAAVTLLASSRPI